MSLLNSGSNLVVLPKIIAQRIGPKPYGEVEVELANGKTIERKAYEIEVEERKGKTRKTKTLATIERRDYPLIGTMAMEKLGVILNIKNGKISFA